MYNYKRDKINNLEIVINEETNASNVDFQGFVNYEREKISYYEDIKENTKVKLSLIYKELEKKILNGSLENNHRSIVEYIRKVTINDIDK